MAETAECPTDFSDLPVPAQLDLPEALAEGLIVPLMNQEVFTAMHDTVHQSNYFFAVGHSAVKLVAHETIPEPEHEHALIVGCEIYEALASVSSPANYRSNREQFAVDEGVGRLAMHEGVRDFLGNCVAASLELRGQAPVLTSTVSEIAAHQLSQNNAAIAYAIAGAGVMRSLHIGIEKRLAA